ncbi:MAG TPA: DUF624 domain-containing protein [Clostridia bacterium]|nr:DUF624 domain-containing protein [Clostridia bacterium]
MKERFRWLKTSFVNTLAFLGDIVILNLLFLVCSVPIVTIGAAATACYAGVSRTLQKRETGLVYKAFFADFRAAFRQSTAGWLLELLVLAILAGDIWFAVVYSEPNNKFFLIFAIIVGAIVLMASLWFYPLVARFQNTFSVQLKNAFLLAFAQFPRTIVALAVWGLVIGLPLLVYEVFAYLGWLWLLGGISLPMYWTVKLFRKMLQLDKAKEEVTIED